MLITKTVKTKWSNSNCKWYESKGYIYTKMRSEFEVKVEDLPNGSKVKVEVKCDCHDCKNPYLKPMSWGAYLKYVKEDGKYYCSYCAKKLYGSENLRKALLKKNGISFEKWCYDNLPNEQAIEILNRWDYELNDCSPNEISYSSHGKKKRGYWFKCNFLIHKSELKNIHNFTNGHPDIINCSKCDSFAQWSINNIGQDFLKNYWSNKNNEFSINPWYISYGSNQEVWWKCECGKHKDYLRTIKNSKLCDFRCPECVQERNESFLQEKVRLYLNELGYEILHENKCTLNPKNIIEPPNNSDIKRRKGTLRYDNEIIIGNKHIFIEVMGSQHEKVNTWHYQYGNKYNTTPEQELEYQIAKDKYKEQYVYQQGNNYHYIAVWYYHDDENKTWKQLIDDKINEILNK